MKKKSIEVKNSYTNRELSRLRFDERVLEEAVDITKPVLERARFFSIFASNIDEFFMIRVASLKAMVDAESSEKDISGMTPNEQIDAIMEEVHRLHKISYDIYHGGIIKELKGKGIVFANPDKLTKKQLTCVAKIFDEKIYPVLTPVVVDKRMPFPLVKNKALYLGLLMTWSLDSKPVFGLVQIPSFLDRVIPVEKTDKKTTYILVEDLIKLYANKLFSSFNIVDICIFRVTRDADLLLANDDAGDLLKSVENKLKLRQWGDVNRLEIDSCGNSELTDYLAGELFLENNAVYAEKGPLDLTFLFELYKKVPDSDLKYKAIIPKWPKSIKPKESILKQIKERDIMLFHPFESFDPVISFIKEASEDPDVVAIKQTLYRVDEDSPIIQALSEAAKNGKQVTALVELKARFDEANNIGFARKLEASGCNVIYGPPTLKTHCKIALVIRKENGGLARYIHLSTGNYNAETAKVYTDIGLFTANEDFGEDATELFNMLSGFTKPEGFRKLSVAPVGLRKKFLELIERERINATEGKPAGIYAKLNSLCDKEIIDALYGASQAGVKIDLSVRGICCLIPGLKGLSDNITVRSLVGRYLEHSRIYCFVNGGFWEYYLSSADWMPRNMDRRVEILFPVENELLKEKLILNLISIRKDSVKARELMPDGVYRTILQEEKYSHHEDFPSFAGLD